MSNAGRLIYLLQIQNKRQRERFASLATCLGTQARDVHTVDSSEVKYRQEQMLLAIHTAHMF